MLSNKFVSLFRIAALFLSLSGFPAHAQNRPVPGANSAPSIWSFEPTPNLGQNNILLALGADSEKDIWAVGDLISEHFDGTAWTAFPMVDLGGTFMNGVAVVSSNNVWAVGETFESGGHNVSTIEHFDGKQWNVVPSPHFPGGDALNGIQLISANDIFAVGSANTDAPVATSPLVEHFDGTQWTVVTTPLLSAAAQLRQISILSDSDMWAVGNLGGLDGQHPTQPLAMHFDGTQWSQVAVPAVLGSFFNDLRAVTAVASNDVWAVGSTTPNTGATVTLAEHWNGRKWRIIRSPNAGKLDNIQGENQLLGVSAISSTDAWAAGFFVDVPHNSELAFLIEHWNGKHWSVSRAPATGTGFDSAHAVLAFPSGNVYVAGSAINTASQLISIILHTAKGL